MKKIVFRKDFILKEPKRPNRSQFIKYGHYEAEYMRYLKKRRKWLETLKKIHENNYKRITEF